MSHAPHDLSGIALIGSDLDGTLLDGDGKIPQATKERLEEWKAASGRFAIVTGRPPWDLFDIVDDNGIAHLLDAVVCEERDIYLNKGGEWVPLGDHGLQLALELSCMPDSETVATAIMADAARRGAEAHRSNPETEAKRGYIELYFHDPLDSEAARRVALESIRSNSFYLSVMRNVRHVSLRHPFSKKGTTLRALAEFWGIVPSGVVAVGDSLNDMSMLDGTFGFLGAAVSNSDPAIVKAVEGSGILLPHARSAGVAHLVGAIMEQRGNETARTAG